MKFLTLYFVTVSICLAHPTNEMVLIPAGAFIMGSNSDEPDEGPQRTVHVSAFYLDRYEVTHEEYARLLKDTNRKPPVDLPDGQKPRQHARHPVVNVTWHDATANAAWAGKRLTTETESEKACRATDGRT